jgi:prolyl-tRNA synthetase
VVIVPIFKNDEEKALVFDAARKIRDRLVKADVRVKVDEREGQSPGFKFNDWEMRGVPLRMEIGPKDVAKGSVVLARRDRPGKEGKSFVSQESIAESVQQSLVEIQKSLFDRALAFRGTHTFIPKNFDEFRQIVETGFAQAYWCGDSKCEEQIKEATKATLRCIPIEQPGGTGSCIFCGQPSKESAIFGKAY